MLLADRTLLVNPDWIDPDAFPGLDRIEVAPGEPYAANALRVGNVVVYSTSFPKTADRLARHGIELRTVDVTELAKAEGGLTCCSIVFAA